MDPRKEFRFALKLLQTTAGNACVSPLNIAHALGLVLLGTEKETREQVVQAMGHKTHEEAHAVLEKDWILGCVTYHMSHMMHIICVILQAII